MKKPTITTICVIVATAIIITPDAWARKKKSAPKVELTQAGQQLEKQYAAQLESLKIEITKALPKLSGAKTSAVEKARGNETSANKALAEAQKNMGEIKKGQALVAHAKGKWIGGAIKGIKAAKEKLKKSKTDAEREAAEKELANWEKNKKDGEDALKERQADLDKALKHKTKYEKALKNANETLTKAKADTLQAVKNLGLKSTLTSDKLDAKLAKFVVIMEATPKGLAAFAEKGAKQKKLIDTLLSSDDLLVQMATADGARNGNYGQAMKILTDIQKASNKVTEGPLPKLALAVALEHATPIKQRNAVADAKAPATVDPVKRYLHFEKAFLDGELDPAFAGLSTWDYRMVVNGEEPNEILTWGRAMLNNYRPDHISTKDYRWRYVALVRSDIRYGSQDNKFDKPELQFFQNILMNGGICGRRAFIGRFTLRAFGIPVIARPQRGHAALAHWTPKGWVVCLGGGWGIGWTKGRYDRDLDFLANTQARATGKPFMQVKRAQWIGDVVGEPRAFGFKSRTKPEFWYSASLYTQKDIIETSKAKTLAAVGEDIGEANVTKEKVEITKVKMTQKDREVTVNKQGVITIPAAATTNPTKSNGKIIFMDSQLGGKQLHFSRNGGGQTFEYTVDAPKAGKYRLTAKVATPSWQQHLVIAVNGQKEAASIELPHTIGMWEDTEPVEVVLSDDKNTLTFSHKTDGYAKGFSIKDFTLTPVK